jgi:hypothetical protein
VKDTQSLLQKGQRLEPSNPPLVVCGSMIAAGFSLPVLLPSFLADENAPTATHRKLMSPMGEVNHERNPAMEGLRTAPVTIISKPNTKAILFAMKVLQH